MLGEVGIAKKLENFGGAKHPPKHRFFHIKQAQNLSGGENSKKTAILGTMKRNPRNGVTARPTNPGNRAHAFRITVVEHLTPSN